MYVTLEGRVFADAMYPLRLHGKSHCLIALIMTTNHEIPNCILNIHLALTSIWEVFHTGLIE